MTPAEAIKILDLPPEASNAQIEERFLALRAQMEEKATRALTPNLATQYRAAFARTTEAYETLVLAADGITPGPPAGAAPGPVPVKSARVAVPFLRGFVATGKGVLPVVSGLLLAWAVMVVLRSALIPPPWGLEEFEFRLAIWVLVGVLPGLAWRWQSFAADRRRLAGQTPAGARDCVTRPLVVGYVLLGVTAGIFVDRDLKEEKEVQQWVDQGNQAVLGRDRTGTMTAFAQASALRPQDNYCRSRFMDAQKHWISALEDKVAGVSAPAAQACLTRGPDRPRFPLQPEVAARYRKLFKATAARMAEESGSAFSALVKLTEQGKFAEARTLVESWRPLAGRPPEFADMEEHLEKAEFDVQFAPMYEAQRKGGFPAAYAVLEKMELKDDTSRRRHRTAVVMLRTQEWLEGLQQAGALLAKGEFIETEDKLTDLEVMAERVTRLEGYAEAFGKDAMDLMAMLANARRSWRLELVRRTVAELIEALAASDAPRAQDILAGYAALQGQAAPVSGEALVKEKFFPQFLDYLAMLNLRTGAPGEPDHVWCLALVEAALPHFTKPEPARQFLAESYHTLAQQGLKNGGPGLALYLQRESVRAGGAADDVLETAALKLFAESNPVNIVFPSFAKEGEQPTALADSLYQATQTAIEQASKGLIVLANDMADEGNPRQFILQGELTGIETDEGQNREKKTVRHQTGEKQVMNPAAFTKRQQLQDIVDGQQELDRIINGLRAKLASAEKTGDANAVAAARKNLATWLKTEEGQRKAIKERQEEIRTIPSSITEATFVEQTYEQVMYHRNHAAALQLTLKHGALADGGVMLATWNAALRYATVEITGDIQRGVPVQAPVFVAEPEVSQRLEANLKAKIAAQTPALLWQLVQAVHAAKEKQLQQNSNRVRLPGDFEWGWVAFWEKCGVLMQTGAAEAAVREDLGLPPTPTPATAAGPFVPMAGWQVENSLGMRFSALPGTKVLCSIWETRVQDFAAFANKTGYQAKPGMKSLTAQGWTDTTNDWRNPGFRQQPSHPVCGVSWTDAVAFATWLTEQEHASGLLPGSYEYRLPTKAEWDLAAVRTASTDTWPMLGAGNLAGVELRDGSAPADFKIIAGYVDGFPKTAPVGSFSSNSLGICDLEGNVKELLDDPMYPQNPALGRRSAGTGFDSSEPEEDKLHGYRPDRAVAVLGFRLVIAPVRAE